MGIVNKGGHIVIQGQAIGKAKPDRDNLAIDSAVEDTSEVNTGIVTYGGTTTVHCSWVNGEWVDDPY